jgi:hypothetical protein
VGRDHGLNPERVERCPLRRFCITLHSPLRIGTDACLRKNALICIDTSGVLLRTKIPPLSHQWVEDHIHILSGLHPTVPGCDCQGPQGQLYRLDQTELRLLVSSHWQVTELFTLSLKEKDALIEYIKVKKSIIGESHFVTNSESCWRKQASNLTKIPARSRGSSTPGVYMAGTSTGFAWDAGPSPGFTGYSRSSPLGDPGLCGECGHPAFHTPESGLSITSP